MATLTTYPGFTNIQQRCVTVDGVAHTVHLGICTDPGLQGERGVFKIDNRVIWRTPEPLRSRIISNAINS